ncbi:replication initiation protein [Antarctic microvirus COCH21_V_SP_13]|nr:replication initiation protein [Antarctic microvirus COCH21_V_SP_13]
MICDSPIYVLPKGAVEKVPVPCGRCPPCKLRRTNSWVFRLMQEEKISTAANFVTLTYDTRTVPISPNGYMTLNKRDYQLFMKRLRKLCPDAKLKYYAVGEYGTTHFRPHYHAIIFNCPDEKLYHEAWGLGAIHVGTVTNDSVAYTMKYIDKLSDHKQHQRDDRLREFPLMSKGIGENYITPAIIQYHNADISRLYLTKQGGHRIALPKYYRQKIYSPDQMKSQVALIQTVVADNENSDRREHAQLYPADEILFDDWQESKKYGRFHKFYNAQNTRDL